MFAKLKGLLKVLVKIHTGFFNTHMKSQSYMNVNSILSL